MRKAFAFAGVDHDFTSEQFDREWERSTRQGDGQIPVHGEADQAARASAPSTATSTGFPERMRWMVEKVVHDPEAPPAPKPELPEPILESAPIGQFTRGRRRPPGVRRAKFSGWKQY